jgi:hypothetical protein
VFKKVFASIGILCTIALPLLYSNQNIIAAGTTSEELKTIVKKVLGNDSSASSFIAKVEQVAVNLNAEPDDLLAIMYFESARTFNPAKKVGICRANTASENAAFRVAHHCSSAIGLIQFLTASANELGIAKCKYDTNGITVGAPLPIIANQTRESQMDCVEAYFKKYSDVDSFDLATLYAAVNYPARRNAPLNGCWYATGSKEFVGNPALAKYAEVSSNGTVCVTKNSATQSIRELLKSAGVTEYTPNQRSSGLSEGDSPQVFPDFEVRELSDAEIQQYQQKLEQQNVLSVNRALDNSIALPYNIFASCNITVTNPSALPLTDTNVLLNCSKSILNYVFIVAVLVIIIKLSTTNLGIVLTSGANGGQPVANARKLLEKSMIGLFLIGSPYLLLDVFSGGVGLFNLVQIEKLPEVRPFQLTIVTGLPQVSSGQPLDFSFLGKGISSYLDPNDQGITGRDAVNISRSGDANNRSKVDSSCGSLKQVGATTSTIFESDKCKVLDMQYINQYYNDSNKPSPFGATSCGASSAVMIANYWYPEKFNNVTGSNNTDNFSLRDQVFYASDYLKKQKAIQKPKIWCYETYGPNNIGKSDVDGAWAITASSESKSRCYLNFVGNITGAYWKMYGVKSQSIGFTNRESLVREIRQAVDQGRPVMMLFFNNYVDGHITTVKGYVKNDPYKIIMNDPWGDFTKSKSPSVDNIGNGVVYDVRELGTISNVFETFK